MFIYEPAPKGQVKNRYDFLALFQKTSRKWDVIWQSDATMRELTL